MIGTKEPPRKEKKKAMDSGRITTKKTEEKKKWNAIFFMDNLPVLRIRFAMLSGIQRFLQTIIYTLYVLLLIKQTVTSLN